MEALLCSVLYLVWFWFQTEGEKGCCSTGSMRKINTFFYIKAWRHVTVDEEQNTNMNLNI